jgi:hypothetical protein
MTARINIVAASLAAIAALSCLGDQLQWNAPGVCEQAVQAIGRQSLLISYCSQASEDRVELWLVRGLRIIDTPIQGLFEVLVLAKCLYRSQRAFSAGEFPVSDDQWTFDRVCDPGWFIEGIDLAYVYLHAGGSSFQCLGKVLELECRVGVETMVLPDDVMEKIGAGGSSGRHMSPLSIESTQERCPVPGRQRPPATGRSAELGATQGLAPPIMGDWRRESEIPPIAKPKGRSRGESNALWTPIATKRPTNDSPFGSPDCKHRQRAFRGRRGFAESCASGWEQHAADKEQ